MSDRNYWTTLRQRKISRRTMLGASAKAGVGVAGLALVGCGDDDEPDAGAVAAERAAAAAEEAAAAAVAAGDARAADSEAAAAVAAAAAAAAADAADAAADAADAAGEASAAASQAASAADAAAALAAEAAESEDAGNAAAAAEAAAAAAAQAADAAGAAGDAAAAAVADAAAEAAEAAAQAARDVAAAVEAGTATAAAAQAAIDNAAEAAAAAAAAAGEASAAAGQAAAAAGQAAATAQETAEAAAETAAAAVAAAEEAADAAREAADSAAMAAEEDEPAPATGPQHGGTLNSPGLDGGILDPAIANHGGTDSIVFPIYDHINYLDNGGTLTAAMAELPEVVDELNFIYAIKPNVHWQDKAPLNGRQFVAEDAVFGLERFGQDNPEFIWRDRYATVDQFEAVNDLTLHITAKEPFAPLLTAVAEIQALMVSRDAVEAFGDDGIASNIEAAIGTGGMQHVSREADVLTVLERNPNYFRAGLPYFDGFRANWNFDAAYRAAQYVAGESDFTLLFRGWAFRRRTRPCGPRSARRTSSKCPCKRPGASVDILPHQGRALHRPARAPRPASRHQPGTAPRGGARLPVDRRADRPRERAIRVDRRRAPPTLPGYRSGALREQDLAEGRRLLDASGYDPASVPPMSVQQTEKPHALRCCSRTLPKSASRSISRSSPTRRPSPGVRRGQFTIHTQGVGGEFDPDVLYGKPSQRRRAELRRILGPRDRRAAGAGTHDPRHSRTGCRSTTRSRPSCSKTPIPRSTRCGGRAGRRTPSLAQGLRPDQQQHRRHPTAVPVVVRGQARRLAGRTSPPAWEPHPLTPSPLQSNGEGGPEGGRAVREPPLRDLAPSPWRRNVRTPTSSAAAGHR